MDANLLSPKKYGKMGKIIPKVKLYKYQSKAQELQHQYESKVKVEAIIASYIGDRVLPFLNKFSFHCWWQNLFNSEQLEQRP